MSTSLYNKYPPGFTFGGKRVLNLGCGYTQYKFPNIVNVDAFENCAPDLKMDLNFENPIPFPDESFDLILANHILEHLKDAWYRFNDCARLLKPNGRLEIYVPGEGSDAIFGYRDHVAQITPHWFAGIFGNYRNGGNAWADDNVEKHKPAQRMKMVDSRYYLEDYWWLRGPNFWKDFCKTHLRNVLRETGFILRKVTQEEFALECKEYEERMLSVPLLQSENLG